VRLVNRFTRFGSAPMPPLPDCNILTILLSSTFPHRLPTPPDLQLLPHELGGEGDWHPIEEAHRRAMERVAKREASQQGNAGEPGAVNSDGAGTAAGSLSQQSPPVSSSSQPPQAQAPTMVVATAEVTAAGT
jgi:hypothetical protein